MNIREKVFFICFAILLICLPLSKAVCNIAEVILVLLSLYKLWEIPFLKKIKENIHIVALTFIFAAYVLGLIHTQNMHDGLKFLNHHHRFVAFPLIIITHLELLRKIYPKLLYAFILGNCIAGAVTLTFYLLPEKTVIMISKSSSIFTDYPPNPHRLAMGLYSPFIDRIQFSNLLGIAILSGMYLLIRKHDKRIFIPAVLFLLLTTLMLGGRGGQIAIVGGIAVYLFWFALQKIMPPLSAKIGKTYAAVTVSASTFFVLIILPLLLFYTVPPIKKRYGVMLKELKEFAKDKNKKGNYEHKTSIRRIISWQNHWAVIKEYPFVGVGTGDYEDALQVAYDQDAYELPVNAHSQYLQVWVCLGIGGLILFLGVIGYWIYTIRESSPEFILALSFMIFYLISFIPDAVLITQIDNMAFSLFFCLFGALRKIDTANSH